jgi:hypothetical protein
VDEYGQVTTSSRHFSPLALLEKRQMATEREKGKTNADLSSEGNKNQGGGYSRKKGLISIYILDLAIAFFFFYYLLLLLLLMYTTPLL